MLALACGTWPASAFADPNTAPSIAEAQQDVAASRAQLEEAIREYEAAYARLAAIDESVAANSTRIDELVAQQSELHAQLGGRARTMYRTGPLGFLEVLVGTTTFNEFLTVWDALLRLNRQDAHTVRKLEQTRSEMVRASGELLEQQTIASRELRALETAKTKARRDLAASTAAYASYQRQVAAREAERARRAQERPETGSASAARPASRPQPTGTGAWKTALASHYGKGSYGIRLASGVTIGPDSMIVAHKTLPIGTLVEFSYKGRVAVAKVMDRGPYTRGREWDLGPGTARVLGFRGVDKVGYRVIGR